MIRRLIDAWRDKAVAEAAADAVESVAPLVAAVLVVAILAWCFRDRS